MYFYDHLKENQHRLNETEKMILDYLLDQATKIKDLTIREVAEDHFTAPNTIIRLCKKLGFKGFSDFKEGLYAAKQTKHDFLEVTPLDEQIVKTKQLVNEAVINELAECLHNANKILFFAVGLSRFPAQELDARLQLVGKNSQIFVDPHVMKHNASLLSDQDLAIAISMSGTTSNVLEATTIATVAGAKTLSITGFSTNPLAKLTTYQLYGYATELRVSGIDAADRFSIHYLINLVFNTYLTKYHT
ncbi:transcriptional regulator, RpiR family [Amphibacillus marinus]|uniref:Transcriptional regulator, RpiR family n=1 Tax=Amphibacillus marinus TaxID=872970 RepID=A0A1H8IRS4_9BACI|nr:MurR/RpiR family transcriptional regulator [Amphibacillus marinus]SEN71081.1 transcriptional regulator, RpiR family [Amphibacillus marinus]